MGPVNWGLLLTVLSGARAVNKMAKRLCEQEEVERMNREREIWQR